MKFNKLLLLCLIIVIAMLASCRKVEKEMLVTTGTASNILANSADISGNILDLGEGPSQYGHCYSKTSGPDITMSKTTKGIPTSTGPYTSSVENLDAGTKYYVKAYLSRGEEVVYGDEINFTTSAASAPGISTAAITSITETGATSGGTITSSGGAPITDKGVCWGTATLPTTSDSKISSGAGSESFVSSITGLTSGTLYYVRAYAINQSGTSYGNELTFRALKAPLATTTTATTVTSTTATLNGIVVANYFTTTVTFEWGLTTSYGSSLTATPSTVNDASPTGVSANIAFLLPGTIYHFRVIAVSNGGTAFGDDMTLLTFELPTASTSAATSVLQVNATLNGTVNAKRSPTTVTFEYGKTTGYGSFATASQSPVNGETNVAVNATLSGLLLNTTYHYRVMAENSTGSVYGNDMTFTTVGSSILSWDMNTYPVIQIGTQVWFKSNLKAVSTYDGVMFSYPIDNITNDAAWASATGPAYCYYNNLDANYFEYGVIYNFYAVITSNHLCPIGWHVPTNGDWDILENYLGGYYVSGGKMKETGTTHWSSPNTGATNESGFNALPGGYRSYTNGAFGYINTYAPFWTSSIGGWLRSLESVDAILHNGYTNYKAGMFVRCIKDN
jgi:uncharacterized protein (TIGR02145 family)